MQLIEFVLDIGQQNVVFPESPLGEGSCCVLEGESEGGSPKIGVGLSDDMPRKRRGNEGFGVSVASF